MSQTEKKRKYLRIASLASVLMFGLMLCFKFFRLLFIHFKVHGARKRKEKSASSLMRICRNRSSFSSVSKDVKMAEAGFWEEFLLTFFGLKQNQPIIPTWT